MFNLINYNIRSFRKNSSHFLPIFTEMKLHALILTETWFTDDNHCSIKKYCSYHTIRSDRQSGGISIFVDENFISRKVQNLSYCNERIEVCSVEILINNEPIYIIGVYRPHCGTIDGFCEEIGSILQNPLLRNRRCAIGGDFNIDMIQENSTNRQYFDTFQSHHYFPVISEFTRFSPCDNTQPSLLDQIWFNSLNLFNSGVISFDTTDHCPTFLQFPVSLSQTSENEFLKITFRLNNQVNRDTFRQRLIDFDWNSLDSDDVCTRTLNFTRKLDSIYCSTFPLKCKMIPKKKALNPWFTPNLSKLAKLKSVYFDLLRIGAVSKQENNNFKNKFKSAVYKAKTSYYKSLLMKNSCNMRSTWTTLNSLMDRKNKSHSIDYINSNGLEIRDSAEISSVFSEYFVDIISDLNSVIPEVQMDPVSYINIDLVSNLSNFDPCTPHEVSLILEGLKQTKQNKNSIPIKLIVANRYIVSLYKRYDKSIYRPMCFPKIIESGKTYPYLEAR